MAEVTVSDIAVASSTATDRQLVGLSMIVAMTTSAPAMNADAAPSATTSGLIRDPRQVDAVLGLGVGGEWVVLAELGGDLRGELRRQTLALVDLRQLGELLGGRQRQLAFLLLEHRQLGVALVRRLRVLRPGQRDAPGDGRREHGQERRRLRRPGPDETFADAGHGDDPVVGIHHQLAHPRPVWLSPVGRGGPRRRDVALPRGHSVHRARYRSVDHARTALYAGGRLAGGGVGPRRAQPRWGQAEGATVITRPSIAELLEGVTLTLERRVLVDPAASGETLTEVLSVVDRIAAESPTRGQFLVDDNEDMRAALQRVHELAGIEPAGGVAAADPPLAIDQLELENRALKQAVVDVIDRLDLPAGDDVSPARRAADREVLDLLLRVLHREAAAAPPLPSRLNPTSGGGGASDPPEVVEAALRKFLAAEMPTAEGLDVREVQRLAGGASREAWTLDVAWLDADGEHLEHCVMLRHPVSSVLESDESEERITGSRRLTGAEFRMIRLMEDAGIPVPHMLWADPDGAWLERPFSIGRWLPGTADVVPLIGTPEAASDHRPVRRGARPPARARPGSGRRRLPRLADA